MLRQTTALNMTGTPYDGTIGWDRYRRESADPTDDDANGSMEFVVGPLVEFIEEKGTPESYGGVGRGGGRLAFTVAGRHPETTVVGYDAAGPVIEKDRRRADGSRHPDVGFERAVLPDFYPDRRFDAVKGL